MRQGHWHEWQTNKRFIHTHTQRSSFINICQQEVKCLFVFYRNERFVLINIVHGAIELKRFIAGAATVELNKVKILMNILNCMEFPCIIHYCHFDSIKVHSRNAKHIFFMFLFHVVHQFLLLFHLFFHVLSDAYTEFYRLLNVCMVYHRPIKLMVQHRQRPFEIPK